jgi:putative DNA primase/helicase
MATAPVQAAIDFLEKLRPGGPWVLTAITPDGPAKTITASTTDEVVAFVNANNNERNLYYSVNPTRTAKSKKAAKTDIAAIEFALADLDPADGETSADAKARYLTQLNGGAFEPKPTAVVDSGNGIQCLWRLLERITLSEPIRSEQGKLIFSPEDQTKIADIEARIAAVMLRLGSKAGTQNIDRILRLPGTTNLPTAKKRKAGRGACTTTLMSFNGMAWPLSAFPLPDRAEKTAGTRDNDEDERSSSKKDLPQELRLMLYLQGDQPAGYASRSELLWAFINAALRKSIDEDAIITACLDAAYAGNSIYTHVQEKGGEDYVKRQIVHTANATATDDKGRVIVIVEEGKLDEVWRATQAALIERGRPVYQRGGRLVEPLWRLEKTNDGRNVLTMHLEPFNVSRLADAIAHHAVRFQKYDGRARRLKNIDPPKAVIEWLLEAKHWLVPTVRGIINAPTMRPDGSLLTEQGYDPATELWYKSSGDVTLPPIPEHPTKAKAEEALALLNSLFDGWPFDGENETNKKSVARAAALAATMTTVLRGALPVAVPIFLITAPDARTGKTFLVQLIARIATGHVPISTAGATNEEEMEKRVETEALSGRPIMHFNNLPNGMVVTSPRLAELCSEGMVTIRKLGRMEEGLCDCRATTVFLNGNNITVAGDLVVRTVLCRLDAKMENPETRKFAFDPPELVRKDRGRYLAAVFTIVRAFRKAGCPPQKCNQVLGFDAWSRLVQQPLLWLGMPDPWGDMETMRAMDPTLEEKGRLFDVLRKYFPGSARFTTADCAQLAEEMTTDANGRPVLRRPDLHALMATNYGKVNSKSFGQLLAKHRDRIHAGWCLKAVPGHAGVAAYRLVGPPGAATATLPGADTEAF